MLMLVIRISRCNLILVIVQCMSCASIQSTTNPASIKCRYLSSRTRTCNANTAASLRMETRAGNGRESLGKIETACSIVLIVVFTTTTSVMLRIGMIPWRWNRVVERIRSIRSCRSQSERASFARDLPYTTTEPVTFICHSSILHGVEGRAFFLFGAGTRDCGGLAAPSRFAGAS